MEPVKAGKIRPQNYVDPRPAGYFHRFHVRARNINPRAMFELVRLFFCLILPFYRPRYKGLGNVPRSGPTILAPNHSSNLDHFYLAWKMFRRCVRFMAKSQMFKWPAWIVFSFGGVYPVRRGKQDQECFDTTDLLLSKGELVAMYPNAGRIREGSLDEQEVLPGVGYAALRSGAKVVPVAIIGSEKARNRTWRIPAVTVVCGEAKYYGKIDDPTHDEAMAVALDVFSRILALYKKHEPWHNRRLTVRLVA
jgi:1-acyl-sn-glycerol-3-phosphate acyltransferase